MVERQFIITVQENGRDLSKMEIKRTDAYLGSYEQFPNGTLHTSVGDFISPQDIQQLLSYLETYLEESWS